MIYKRTIQLYIFEREGGHCYHCGKVLKPGKMTLDHYYPRSLGGTEEFYNLVASCKLCNKFKKSVVPKDWIEVNIELLLRAIADEMVVFDHSLKHEKSLIISLLPTVRTIEHSKSGTQFEGRGFRVLLKDNRVVKLVRYGEL